MKGTYEILESSFRGFRECLEVLEDVVREAVYDRHADVKIVMMLYTSALTLSLDRRARNLAHRVRILAQT